MLPVKYESSFFSLVPCFLLAGLYVGSLYVRASNHARNHPSTIKQRFCRVFVVVIISPFILKFFIVSEQFKRFTIFELLGFRLSGFFSAAVIPLFLTMILFIGPLCMQDYSVLGPLLLSPRFWVNNFRNLVWIRNIIVGPFSEEFTFRACMMPLLLQSYSPVTAVFICSLFFGLAHVHHVIELYKAGEPFSYVFIGAFVQFSYTSLFGAYSAFVFLRSAHFVSLFLVHAFCNAMTFPDFQRIFTYENPKKTILLCLFTVGLILWFILLDPLMDHHLYNNDVFFGEEVVP